MSALRGKGTSTAHCKWSEFRCGHGQVADRVMVAIDYDPLALHYVASLARPDGNVTGVFFQQVELAMKRLQLMKDALPNVEAATVFWDGSSADQWQASQRAGATLGLRLVGIELSGRPYDYQVALNRAAPDHRGALVVRLLRPIPKCSIKDANAWAEGVWLDPNRYSFLSLLG